MEERDEAGEAIPTLYLNPYLYCSQCFYCKCMPGEMVVNEHVLEGQQLHERVNIPASSRWDGKERLRRISLCAARPGVPDYCDLLSDATGRMPLYNGQNSPSLNVSSPKRSSYKCAQS